MEHPLELGFSLGKSIYTIVAKPGQAKPAKIILRSKFRADLGLDSFRLYNLISSSWIQR